MGGQERRVAHHKRLTIASALAANCASVHWQPVIHHGGCGPNPIRVSWRKIRSDFPQPPHPHPDHEPLSLPAHWKFSPCLRRPSWMQCGPALRGRWTGGHGWYILLASRTWCPLARLSREATRSRSGSWEAANGARGMRGRTLADSLGWSLAGEHRVGKGREVWQ